MAALLFVYKLQSPHDLCLSILFSIGLGPTYHVKVHLRLCGMLQTTA